MKKVFIIAGAVTLICFGIIFAVMTFWKKQNDEAVKEAESIAAEHAANTASIVTAATDIANGTTITSGMLTTVDVDRSVLSTVDAATELEMVIGKQAVTDIASGSIIRESYIADKDELNKRVAFLVPFGMYAFELPCNMDSSVAGHVEAGDYVDLLYYPKADESGSRSTLSDDTWEVAVENIEVIKLGDITYTGEGVYSYVILAAERDTVMKVLNIEQSCDIKMILRSRN